MATQASLTVASLKDVICLNNEGVGCLVLCEPDAAHHRFKTALSMLNSHMRAHDDFAVTASATAGHSQTASFAIPALKDDCFYIHNHAQTLNTGMMGSPQDFHEASSILVFNLALSSHLSGMVSNSEAKLRKACRLYGMCYDLVIADDIQDLTSTLAVASMNNLAQIKHRFLADHSKAVEILTSLQLGAALAQTTYLNNMDIDEILLNICTITVSKSMGAPAA